MEFLVEGKEFHFIEVNARIQVEHPVTELLTGHRPRQDADPSSPRASRCPASRTTCAIEGHAIECRINAEDPENELRAVARAASTSTRRPAGPASASTRTLAPATASRPTTTRMIGKLIVHGDDRAEAIARMRRALDEYVIEGVKTTLPLLRRVLRNSYFVAGDYSTRFLDAMLST